MNKTKKKRKKTFVFLFGLAVAMLSTPPVQAQGLLENLLDEYYAEKDQQSNNNGGVMGRGSSGGYNLTNQQFGSDANGGYNLFNQTFGQENEGSLGSGFAIFMVAGAGYAVMKSRKKAKNEQVNKERKLQ